MKVYVYTAISFYHFCNGRQLYWLSSDDETLQKGANSQKKKKMLPEEQFFVFERSRESQNENDRIAAPSVYPFTLRKFK